MWHNRRRENGRLPLGHLLKDKEALLDNFDRLRVAYKLLLLDNGDLARAEAAVIEVSVAVEVIERVHRAEAAPVVKVAGRTTGNCSNVRNVKDTTAYDCLPMSVFSVGREAAETVLVRAERATMTTVANLANMMTDLDGL